MLLPEFLDNALETVRKITDEVSSVGNEGQFLLTFTQMGPNQKPLDNDGQSITALGVQVALEKLNQYSIDAVRFLR